MAGLKENLHLLNWTHLTGFLGRRHTLSKFKEGLSGWTVEGCAPVLIPARALRRMDRSQVIVPSPANPMVAGFGLWIGQVRSELSEWWATRWQGTYQWQSYAPVRWLDERPTVIAQWHAVPSWWRGEIFRSPPLAVRMSRNELLITARYSRLKLQKDNIAEELLLYRGPAMFSKVMDWYVRVRFSHGSGEEGTCEVWLNREKIVMYKGPIGYNDRCGPFFKFGLYNSEGVMSRQVIYHWGYGRLDRNTETVRLHRRLRGGVDHD